MPDGNALPETLPPNALSPAPSEDLEALRRLREDSPPYVQRLIDVAFAVGASTVESVRKPVIDELESKARYEPLTGLLTRTAFEAVLDKTISEVRHGKYPGMRVALIKIDLKDFKQYNDLYGEHIGDLVLSEGMAETLKKETRVGTKSDEHSEDFAVSFRDFTHHTDELRKEGGEAARYGGDEFALLFLLNENYRDPNHSNDDTETALARQCNTIKLRLKTGFKGRTARALERHEVDATRLIFPIDTSVGTVLLQDGENAQDLMIRGDFAMKADKNNIAQAHGGAYRQIE